MAGAAPTMLTPPEGWQPHDFWGNLGLDARQHMTSLLLGAAFLLLLLMGRALLHAQERKRLRLAVAFFVMFFVSWPARALVLSYGAEGSYGGLVLAASVLQVWGMIGVGGLVFFDLAGRKLGVPKILRDLTITIASLAALVMLLSRSGVNLLSIITTSAVLTAVIGLALQDTLGNLMSGIALQLESSVAIGDWIRVDEKGQIGKVREIRWRSTVIETRNGDLVIIPNSMLTKSVLTNFAKDGLENRRWVYFNVHMRHPPNDVQKVVIGALQGIPNVSERTPPDCVLMGFEESWAKWAVRYRLVDFRPDDPTDSEVRKRIWYALHRANIEIPYPGFNIFTTELNAERAAGKSEQERARRLVAIASVSIFEPLDGAERDQLAAGMRREVYGRGEAIIRAGAPGDSLYVISSGKVSVRIGINGLEKEVATLEEGKFFGEMSLMTGEPRTATVIAQQDTECFVVDRALFHEILIKKGSLVGEIGKLLAERQSALEGKRDDLTAQAARQNSQQALLTRIKGFFGIT
jgi:small-conductance mechanosensitive channel/CRP-like cAMP-binding protein